MNTVWSERVQSIDCLYTSRALRFADRFRERYTPFFAIPPHARILEVGCGPGALCEALARWYPDATVHGADRDSQFVAYAAEHIPVASFSEEDATALSFADGSFDVTISNTVSEHVEPSAFFGEQYRVLREGGVCLLLSVRRSIQHLAPCVAEESELEREIWARVGERCRELDRELGIGAYPLTEQELPLTMQRHGFRQVSVDYVTAHMTPDDPRYEPAVARAMIESERASHLNAVSSLLSRVPELVTEEDIRALSEAVHGKFDRRLALYEAGEAQWDTYVSLTMMVRGVK